VHLRFNVKPHSVQQPNFLLGLCEVTVGVNWLAGQVYLWSRNAIL
jgi:hypothetical protein